MRKAPNPKYEIRNPEPETRIRRSRVSNFELRTSCFAFGLLLLAGMVFAQYDEIWEDDVYSPHSLYTIGIAQAIPDSTGMQLVFIDEQYRTDQYQYVRMVNASTGEDIWESDTYYYIYTEAPNQPRLMDIDGDGLAELIMLVEYDPGYAVWTMYKYDGRTGKPHAAKPARPRHKLAAKTTTSPATHSQN